MTLNINVRISYDPPTGQAAWVTVNDLIHSEQRTKANIMASTQETLDALGTVVEKLNKVKAESEATRAAVDTLTAKVAELQALLDNATIPDAITAKIAEVAAAVDAVDAVVPDAAP